MKRRDFIKTTAVTIPIISLFPADLSAIRRKPAKGKIEKRALGKTGEMLSIIGFGGIVVRDATTAVAAETVKLAIDKGINYFDVAPSYGNAEVMLGPALEPYRKDVFLACKTQKRTRDEARTELEQSLKNLRTDHFDLYQFHAVTKTEDVEQIFAVGGAMETVLRAREEGKIKYIGFSAHSESAALAMMDRFPFDSILFPFNMVCYEQGNFGPAVMEAAKQKGVARLALKMLARGPWPDGAKRTYPKAWYEPILDAETARAAVRFTLSEDVTAAIPPGDVDLFNLALTLASDFQPLSPEERAEILAGTRSLQPLFHS